MKKLWERFQIICVILVVDVVLHELLIGLFHEEPVYWINW